MKKLTIVLIILVLIGVGIYFWTKGSSTTPVVPGNQIATTTPTNTQTGTQTPVQNKAEEVIGKSVEGRDIIAYHFGTGSTEVLFIGGIHGGYEWNTVLLASQMMDYLKANPNVIPSNVKVTIIPVLNPDGLDKVVGTATGNFTSSDVASSQTTQISGRFNANSVDLSRNFDCNWQAKGTWQNKSVSGGAAAFSEPESQALKDYVLASNPSAVVVWYSSAGGVYSSSCNGPILSATRTLTTTYAKASEYPAYSEFNAYPVTGDVVDWLAKEKIPAISVLLTTHSDVEFNKNLAGVEAILKRYAQ